jgi:hypothetical protein
MRPVLVSLSACTGVSQEAKRPPVHLPPPPHYDCMTVVQGYSDIPNIPLLQADVPVGAIDDHPIFQVKGPHPGDVWAIECAPSTTCNGAITPDMSTPSADPEDGAIHYSAQVVPQHSTGNPVFSVPVYARLVSQYVFPTIPFGGCFSQVSFEVAPDADAGVQIVVPKPGKTITRFQTYMRELVPGSPWIPCDDVVNPPPGNIVYKGCANDFKAIYAYVAQPPDPADHAQSVLVTCTNKIVDQYGNTSYVNQPRGCRVQLWYGP